MKGNYNQVDPTSEVYRVGQQIERVNDAFSSFGYAPEQQDSKLNTFSNVDMAHQGKRIALSLLTLEAMVKGKLEKIGFYKSKTIMEAKYKAFAPEEEKTGESYQMMGQRFYKKELVRRYMSTNINIQMDALEDLNTYYAYLYDSIISLPEFASALRVSSSDNEEEVIDEVDETEVA